MLRVLLLRSQPLGLHFLTLTLMVPNQYTRCVSLARTRQLVSFQKQQGLFAFLDEAAKRPPRVEPSHARRLRALPGDGQYVLKAVVTEISPGSMRVVSGPIGRPKIYFVAPAADQLEKEMPRILQ